MERFVPKAGKNAPRKPRRKVSVQLASPTGRARITNGRAILPGVDGRSSWARRLKDLIALHSDERGGHAGLTEAQRVLVRKVCCLTLETERMELRFALAGGAKPEELDVYQRLLNSIRRTFDALDASERTPRLRDVTPRAGRNGHRPRSTYGEYIEVLDAEIRRKGMRRG